MVVREQIIALNYKLGLKLVVLFLLCGRCSSSPITSDHENETRGLLTVSSIEISALFPLSFSGLTMALNESGRNNDIVVCLTSSIVVNPDPIKQCSKSSLKDQDILRKRVYYENKKKFNPVKVRIPEQTSASVRYYLLIKTTNETNDENLLDGSYTKFLRPVFASNNRTRVSLSPRDPPTIFPKREISAYLSITCAPGNFATFCSVPCQPPNERFVCNERTGELGCASSWWGKYCNETGPPPATTVNPTTIEEAEPSRCAELCVEANTIKCDDDFDGGYTCHCKSGYNGANCQNNQGPSYTTIVLTRALVGTIVPVVVLIIFCIVFSCWNKRQKAARRARAASRRTQPRNYQNIRRPPLRISSPARSVEIRHLPAPIYTSRTNQVYPHTRPVPLNLENSRPVVGDLLGEIARTLHDSGIDPHLNLEPNDNTSVNLNDLNLDELVDGDPDPPEYYEAEPPAYEELPPSYEKAISKTTHI